MSDPRLAKTLGEACQNADGSYNFYRLMSWLSSAVTDGKGVSEEEARSMVDDVLKRKQNERARGRNT